MLAEQFEAVYILKPLEPSFRSLELGSQEVDRLRTVQVVCHVDDVVNVVRH
jgi:hypothetical protein